MKHSTRLFLKLVCSILVITNISLVSAEQTEYVAVDLGRLSVDDTISVAAGINSRSQIVGSSRLDIEHSAAFIWAEDDGMTDIGHLNDLGKWTFANEINERGDIAGSSRTTETGSDHAFLWTEQDGMTDLGVLGRHRSNARGINNRGDVVGWSYVAPRGWHAFLWTQEQGMIDLGIFEGANATSIATAVNDRRIVVGSSSFGEKGDEKSYPFVWSEEDGMTYLGSIDNIPGAALDINNRGEIIGVSRNDSGQAVAVLWKKNREIIELGNFGGIFGQPFSINELGEIVGVSRDTDGVGQPFIWTMDGGMQKLETLPGGNGGFATHINNRGQIVGASCVSGDLINGNCGSGGEMHATLWERN